jgi:preprotein translocase subunit SecG
METFLKVLHVAICLFLIVVVLLQAGKGGGVGIAFGGGGGSQTVFGSSGAGNFLTKLTSVTAFLFLVTSLGLSHYSSQQDSSRLQHLAERKADEKRAEDARAAKLAADLDKARAAAKKMDGTSVTPVTSDAPSVPAATSLKLLGDKLTMPGASKTPDDTADKPVVKTTEAAEAKAKGKVNAKAKAATEGAAAATAAADGTAPAKPKRKRHVAPAAPADGATKAVPAEAPAAPAAPAQ